MAFNETTSINLPISDYYFLICQANQPFCTSIMVIWLLKFIFSSIPVPPNGIPCVPCPILVYGNFLHLFSDIQVLSKMKGPNKYQHIIVLFQNTKVKQRFLKLRGRRGEDNLERSKNQFIHLLISNDACQYIRKQGLRNFEEKRIVNLELYTWLNHCLRMK